jgi:hypothetical protein
MSQDLRFLCLLLFSISGGCSSQRALPLLRKHFCEISPKLALVFRVEWDESLTRGFQNYGNIKDDKVRGRVADRVRYRNEHVCRRAEGASGGATASGALCVRLGDGIQDPAESENQSNRDDDL